MLFEHQPDLEFPYREICSIKTDDVTHILGSKKEHGNLQQHKGGSQLEKNWAHNLLP